jgi:hypothetical protein
MTRDLTLRFNRDPRIPIKRPRARVVKGVFRPNLDHPPRSDGTRVLPSPAEAAAHGAAHGGGDGGQVSDRRCPGRPQSAQLHAHTVHAQEEFSQHFPIQGAGVEEQRRRLQLTPSSAQEQPQTRNCPTGTATAAQERSQSVFPTLLRRARRG